MFSIPVRNLTLQSDDLLFSTLGLFFCSSHTALSPEPIYIHVTDISPSLKQRFAFMEMLLPALITSGLAFASGYLFARGVRQRSGSERA